jgi:adenylate cyclase
MDDTKRVAAEIRDYLARERISREQFAFKTKLGKSTVDKLLTGLYSDKTLAVVEGATGLQLRSRQADPTSVPGGAPAKPDKPSIAVLPFTNMSGDAEHEFLADGLTEDITTALARLSWLFVIARNSTFVYKGKAVDVRDVARDLGVR